MAKDNAAALAALVAKLSPSEKAAMAQALKVGASAPPVGTILGIGVASNGKVEFTVQGADGRVSNWKPQLHANVLSQILGSKAEEIKAFLAANADKLM